MISRQISELSRERADWSGNGVILFSLSPCPRSIGAERLIIEILSSHSVGQSGREKKMAIFSRRFSMSFNVSPHPTHFRLHHRSAQPVRLPRQANKRDGQDPSTTIQSRTNESTKEIKMQRKIFHGLLLPRHQITNIQQPTSSSTHSHNLAIKHQLSLLPIRQPRCGEMT